MTASRFAEALFDEVGVADVFVAALEDARGRLPPLGRSLIVGAPSSLATSYCDLLDPIDRRRALCGGY